MSYRIEEIPELIRKLYEGCGSNPEEQASMADIERALQNLPPGYASHMLYLTCVDGLSVNQAAQQLGISHGKAARDLTWALQTTLSNLNSERVSI